VAERVVSQHRRKTALPDLLAAERRAQAAAKHAQEWAEPLRKAAASAMTPSSLDAVLADALGATADALSADAAAILLASPEGDELVTRASIGLGREIEVKMRIPAGGGVAGRVLGSAQPLIVPDLSRVEVASGTLRRSGVRSWAGVPLRSGDCVLGVMHVASRQVDYFSEEDLEVLEVLADPIAAAIERVRLFEAERAARETAELAVELLRSLQRITAALASARSTDQVCDVILRESVPRSSSKDERGIWMLRGGRLVLVAGGAEAHKYPEIPLDSTMPALDNLEEGTPLFVETREEVLARWPALSSAPTAAFAGFPLIVEGKTIGVMAIGYGEDHVFDEPERAYLTAAAEQAALALDRASVRVREDSVSARRELLAEASIVISEPSRQPDRMLGRLAEFVVPRLADACVILLARGDTLEPAAFAPSAELSGHTTQLLGELPVNSERHGPIATVMRSGLPALVDHSDLWSLDSAYGRFARSLQLTSAMLVPLMVHGRSSGVVLFAARSGRRPFDREDLDLATDLGARAAAAAEDIAVRAREHTFTEMLTRALLPSRFPVMADLAFAARYVPADHGPVGGDWYDVFELPDGKIGLVIGDVAGHGVEAASTMARLRNGLFAYATEGHRATAIFERLAGLLSGPSGDWQVQDPMATVIYAIYDRDSRHIVTSCTGHPPWLRLHGDKAEYVPCGGRVLAPGLETICEEHIVPLEREDTLLFFTDGLVERPGEPFEKGLDRLAEAVSGAGEMRLEALCDLALTATAPDLGRHDDCCLLAVRLL
jgi:sigma-B regulation protein RsbU (phosphoserine phosphatase)